MKKVEVILFIVVLFLIAILSFLFVSYKKGFKIPSVDKNASKYSEPLNMESIEMGKDYIIYIDGDMKVKNNTLKTYIASDKKNKVYVKIRIYQDKKVIGETGLIYPGYYIDSIKLKEKINGTITIKVMGYNMKDYTSAGSAKFEVKVNKK